MITPVWNDFTNLISKLTLRKAWNIIKVFWSYHYSKYAGTATLKGLPFSVSIEPTTSCNLRCPECPSGLRAFTRNTGMLDEIFFKEIIQEIHRDLLYLSFYFQGEPYLNSKLLDMIEFASDHNIYTSTSTNGHFLNQENAKKTVESGLDRLIISIDGTTQEVYEQYRVGGKLSKVVAGVKSIVKWKEKLKSKTPHIIIQFLVVKPNEHQISEVIDLQKESGADDLWFKTAQVYEYENGNSLIPTIEKYSRYKINPDGTYRIKNTLINHCWKMWHSCVITWDGNVVPCCFDKDAKHQLGNLKQRPLSQIWKSEAYTAFRNAVLTSRNEIDICKNCSEGMSVIRN
ncbi:MAG: SPASM domain-containing protein [Chitinophagales bacterium]|nr:SPASM domain-containing protein [Chitinophagales bacterium]